ncbi:hypothetical protein Pelo_17128 [Pelomyxa schiedti]|nr:hypothetical protein Pelo_17128 [Pelomyxa schiedti]
MSASTPTGSGSGTSSSTATNNTMDDVHRNYKFIGKVMGAARNMQLRGHPVDVSSSLYGTGHLRLDMSLTWMRSPTQPQYRNMELLAYSSSEKNRLNGIPCGSMTSEQIADMLMRGAGIDPISDAYKETPNAMKHLEMWWFDKVLTAIAPNGCYIEPEYYDTLCLFGEPANLKEPIPTPSCVQHYADSHPNRLHPFLLGPPPASESLAQTLLQIDQAGSAANWPVLLDLVKSNPESFITRLHPDSTTGFAPLHHAARGNAPADVITTLKSLGGDTNQRSVEGTPFEIARARGHTGILNLLHHRL